MSLRTVWPLLVPILGLVGVVHSSLLEAERPPQERRLLLDYGPARPGEPPQDCLINRYHRILDEGGSLPADAPRRLWRRMYPLVAYAEAFSHGPQDPIRLRVAGGLLFKGSRLARCEVRDALDLRVVYTQSFAGVAVRREPIRSFYRGGAGFSASASIEGGKLPPGVYRITLVDDAGGRAPDVYVNVREPEGPGRARVVVSVPTLTLHAYNPAGGGSLYYVDLSTPAGYEPAVTADDTNAASLLRPLFFDDMPLYHTPEPTLAFLRVLRRAGVPYRVTDSIDLHLRPQESLSGAEVLVLTGHDEYWTKESRAALDAFVAAGGRLANFGGNVCWWRCAIKDQVIYLDRTWGDVPSLDLPVAETGPTSAKRIDEPPERLLGVTYYLAGLPIAPYVAGRHRSWLPVSAFDARLEGIPADTFDRCEDVFVLDADHPIFEGTGLSHGEGWGRESDLLHEELDGIPLLTDSNQPDPAVRDQFPADLRILATADVFNGYRLEINNKVFHRLTRVGIMVETTPFRGGGRVVSLGSIGCGVSLHHGDRITERVVLNTIRYLLEPPK